MSGWVKLWRNMFTDELLNLESKAFKIWIYCLVMATPYSDSAQGLAVGELRLSYRTLQNKLQEGTKKLGMTTISSSLNLLVEKGFLRLEPSKLEGTKVSVTNWNRYQFVESKSVASFEGQASLSSPKLLRVFEQEFDRKLSIFEQGLLSEWESIYAPDLICEALKLGSCRNKRSLAYIGGILKKRRAEQLSKSLGTANSMQKREWNIGGSHEKSRSTSTY